MYYINSYNIKLHINILCSLCLVQEKVISTPNIILPVCTVSRKWKYALYFTTIFKFVFHYNHLVTKANLISGGKLKHV